MPHIYTVIGAERFYLRTAADGAIVLVNNRAEADDIRIETPYSAEPLTLRDAAIKGTSVFLQFPDTHPLASSGVGRHPLHPVTDGIVSGAALAASTDGDPLYRRWLVRSSTPDSQCFTIHQAIAPRYGIGVDAATPILSDTPQIFWDEPEPIAGGICDSCGSRTDHPTLRWCCHGCRCDVEPDYERSMIHCW
jgi:hypothetical protein